MEKIIPTKYYRIHLSEAMKDHFKIRDGELVGKYIGKVTTPRGGEILYEFQNVTYNKHEFPSKSYYVKPPEKSLQPPETRLVLDEFERPTGETIVYNGYDYLLLGEDDIIGLDFHRYNMSKLNVLSKLEQPDMKSAVIRRNMRNISTFGGKTRRLKRKRRRSFRKG